MALFSSVCLLVALVRARAIYLDFKVCARGARLLVAHSRLWAIYLYGGVHDEV
jgi:hypothetical protein